MNFLAPGAFVFLAALPVVVVFYLLKRRRVVKLVPSTLLWQKFLAESQASAPFQKLRHNWLLLLQLLLLLLVIVALARPYFAAPVVGGRLLVAVLDASASMQATDAAPSRFDQARAGIGRLIDSLQASDQLVLLQCAAVTEVKQSATSDKAVLRRALQQCVVTDGPTRLTEALKLAQTLTRDQANAEIHLYSDGAALGLEEFENQGLPLTYHCLGQRGRNVGITAFEVRVHPEDPGQRALFASLANDSDQPQSVELELRFEDRILAVKPLTLAPRETNSPQAFVASQTSNGVFTVRLNVQDDLAADNQAMLFSRMPQPVNVLLVTRGNRFLEKALRATAQVRLSVAADLTDDARGLDLVVLDNVIPTTWPAVNVLAFRVARTNWFEILGPVESPVIVDWRNTHPLLRFTSFDNIQIASSLAVTTPSWAVSLLDSQRTPLMLAGELDRQRIIWAGFPLLDSTWPLRVSFPIFVANVIDWLNPATDSVARLSLRAGEPFRFAPPPAASNTVASVTVTRPDGVTRTVTVDPTAKELVFGDTAQRGVYRLRQGTNETVFCANVLDAIESDTMPRTELKFGKYGQVAATTVRQANLEHWRWIAAAGLLVLLFEWWYYHKRTA